MSPDQAARAAFPEADRFDSQELGQVLLVDPRVSEAYLDLWALLQDTHGDAFYARLNEQGVRRYPSGVPAYQALGAGEGLIAPCPGEQCAIKECRRMIIDAQAHGGFVAPREAEHPAA